MSDWHAFKMCFTAALLFQECEILLKGYFDFQKSTHDNIRSQEVLEKSKFLPSINL